MRVEVEEPTKRGGHVPMQGIVFTVRSASLLARQSYAHLFILPQVSLSDTVRLKIRWSGVESLSGVK